MVDRANAGTMRWFVNVNICQLSTTHTHTHRDRAMLSACVINGVACFCCSGFVRCRWNLLSAKSLPLKFEHDPMQQRAPPYLHVSLYTMYDVYVFHVCDASGKFVAFIMLWKQTSRLVCRTNTTNQPRHTNFALQNGIYALANGYDDGLAVSAS